MHHTLINDTKTKVCMFVRRRGKFNDMLKQLKPEKRDFHKDISKKRLLISMMMTACDLAQTTKPWEAQYQVSFKNNFI